MNVTVYETSAKGRSLELLPQPAISEAEVPETLIKLMPNQKYQKITGIGGSFTEASAHLINQLSSENREKIIEAYFGDSGAKYSLTRTHINSCDFSLGQYAYAPVEGDTSLLHFTVKEDEDDIIPMIKAAMEVSTEGFKIISSPWTAPPWMKDNNDWIGGKLLPKYYPTWALYFSKYIEAYQKHGIPIWGITIENEPLGNDNNWESMHYTPQEMNTFLKNHLGPLMRSNGHDVKILGYDQNRDEELYHWTDVMYDDPQAKEFYDGTAIHWYASTYDYFPDALQYAHQKAPDKHLIQTEACVDAEIPVWQDDSWYWSKEATDWGWDWAPEDRKHLHPRYVPVYRYARDIIGCFNNHVDGWVDWNMVLNRQGGPNWAKNWCIAPVIVDTDNDEVYFTPLYYTMAHFSRFIRPGAERIGFDQSQNGLMCTAVENTDGKFVVVVLNQDESPKSFSIQLNDFETSLNISGKALQTIIIEEL